MKKKIVFLPLDERPCSYDYPFEIFGDTMELVRPDRAILGDKKRPADARAVAEFLERSCADADGLVLSFDMLLYGGLIPSRLHTLAEAEVSERLSVVPRLKERNKQLKIYAFCSVMRCPQYSNSDEEPDYYGECGAEIQLLGALTHRERLKIADASESSRRSALESKLTPGAMDDYRNRRAFNLGFGRRALELLKDGVLEFLILPQDDSAPYGFTAMDQEVVRKDIAEYGLQSRALIYPGSDEVGITLTARMLNDIQGITPRVFVKYAAYGAPGIIPLFEDRPLGETVKYHIVAAGCRLAYAPEFCDFALAIPAPGGAMMEAANQAVRSQAYTVERCLTEFVADIVMMTEDGIPVTIGDNAYANGADLELLDMLVSSGVLPKLAGYAGWNTSSNTLGTAVGEAVAFFSRGATQGHMNFLAERVVDDAGYMSVVRRKVKNERLSGLGMNYFDVRESRGEISAIVKEELDSFRAQRLGSFGERIIIEDVIMPWRRMFEIGLSVRYGGKA